MVSSSQSNNSRLAKNTTYMYIRMFIQMIISLYTSRVVLNTLGVEDFGTYGVVGGIVAFFSIINGTLRSATSRFITYEVGKGTIDSINKVFSLSVILYLGFIIFVILIGETVGLWFVSNQLNFPENRMNAVFWVYQASLVAFCFTMIKVPYESIIVSHEKFSFFAITGVLESILRLLAVFSLTFFGSDKLITYAILMMIISLSGFLLFYYYSNKITIASKFKMFWNKALAMEVFSFTGWNLFGSIAQVGASQGINIFVNIFLGVTVNAAVSIANQVNGATYRFVSNFQVAFHPQITKSIARQDKTETFSIINNTTKISYFLLLTLTLPLFFCLRFVLTKWLGIVPDFTVGFCKMILLFSLVDALAGPLFMSALAIGNIRIYQIWLSIIVALNIPLTYLVLRLNFPPFWIFGVRAFLNFVSYIFRIFYLRNRLGLPLLKYFRDIILPVTVVSIIAATSVLLLSLILNVDKWTGVIPFVLLSFLITSLVAFFGGFKTSERKNVIQMVKSKIQKK